MYEHFYNFQNEDLIFNSEELYYFYKCKPAVPAVPCSQQACIIISTDLLTLLILGWRPAK